MPYKCSPHLNLKYTAIFGSIFPLELLYPERIKCQALSTCSVPTAAGHPMYWHSPATPRPKSQNKFLGTKQALPILHSHSVAQPCPTDVVYLRIQICPSISLQALRLNGIDPFIITKYIFSLLLFTRTG
jgi:hypothetical protein